MMELSNLSDQVRGLMLGEARADFADGTLYLSPRLSPQGRLDWPNLLGTAIESGTPESLAVELRRGGRLLIREISQRRGSAYWKAIPHDAPETLAQGEFNRFYIRGVCLAALEGGAANVEIYRAKAVRMPRRESVELEGTLISASALLSDLRNHPGIDTALGLPPGPNSGLSVRSA